MTAMSGQVMADDLQVCGQTLLEYPVLERKAEGHMSITVECRNIQLCKPWPEIQHHLVFSRVRDTVAYYPRKSYLDKAED